MGPLPLVGSELWTQGPSLTPSPLPPPLDVDSGHLGPWVVSCGRTSQALGGLWEGSGSVR
jgi:hypothetical protein